MQKFYAAYALFQRILFGHIQAHKNQRESAMRLPQQLRKIREQSRSSLPPALREALQRLVAELKRCGIESGALRAGMPAPDFMLQNVAGREVSLSGRLAHGPVVLSFYRGGWCPYCSAELRALQFALPELRGLGASLIALSPELPDHSLSLAEKLALDFDILSDLGNAVARRYGLVFRIPSDLAAAYLEFGLDLSERNGDSSWELPIPATYLIGSNGLIRLAFIDADFTERLDPSVILDVLRRDAAA